MKTIRQIGGALILSAVLAVTTFAGDQNQPGDEPPPPPPDAPSGTSTSSESYESIFWTFLSQLLSQK